MGRPQDPPGQQRVLAAGRASEVVLLDERRVLRRIHGRADHEREAALMAHARSAGYPVPDVLEVRPDGLVMERVLGPTMGADLAAHPWRLRAHARSLADLHRWLHAIAPPPEARARYGEPDDADAFLHGDLHPLNVLLSPGGPVVIDWTNAGRGPAGADVADTWLVLASARVSGAPPWLTVAIHAFLREFLARAGREDAARNLGRALSWRLRDPHLAEAEREAMRRVAARHSPPMNV